MFCFLQLPYHPNSTVHIACREVACTRRRLYQYYSTEMTAEVIENTRIHLGELDQKERRRLFRRSRSEPLHSTSESINLTSRTDPEWNMSVDSISLQSSFIDYQLRRKQRLRSTMEHKKSEISLSSEISQSDPEMKEQNDIEHQMSDIKMPSTLSLTDSDNSHSSNEITSSQAKEISYEEEMRLFMEKNGHLVTNVFADPFDSDERKSRTEMWVEASTENLLEAVEAQDEHKTPGRTPITHQDTEESLISSNVTVDSLMKSTFKENLKEATEAQSEIDVNDVDRFWDYLYKKDEQENEEGSHAFLDGHSTSDSNRSLGMSLSPIKVDFAGIVTENKSGKPEEMGKDERDREVEEVVQNDDQNLPALYFQLNSTDKECKCAPANNGANFETSEIETRTFSSQTELVKLNDHSRSISRNLMEKKNLVREFSFKLSESLFKDLKIFIVERDRAKEAIRILPAKTSKELSEECNYFQTRYRVRIEQNKEKLDRRIDELWGKLLKMPIESQEIIDFISVAHSEQLTLNARRNLPEMFRHDN